MQQKQTDVVLAFAHALVSCRRLTAYDSIKDIAFIAFLGKVINEYYLSLHKGS